MAVLLGTFEQMKLDEARDLFEMRLAAEPDLLESHARTLS
jgi:hypothetical protein